MAMVAANLQLQLAKGTRAHHQANKEKYTNIYIDIFIGLRKNIFEYLIIKKYDRKAKLSCCKDENYKKWEKKVDRVRKEKFNRDMDDS